MQHTFHFFAEDIDFALADSDAYPLWLRRVCDSYEKKVSSINYIFCSDNYLHRINVEYLGHDNYTDIITFPLHQGNNPIEADIFISIDRIRENAATYKVHFAEELRRVMAHGLLHLFGLGDKSDKEISIMRKAEKQAIGLFGEK